jgi:hypothetical protein
MIYETTKRGNEYECVIYETTKRGDESVIHGTMLSMRDESAIRGTMLSQKEVMSQQSAEQCYQ